MGLVHKLDDVEQGPVMEVALPDIERVRAYKWSASLRLFPIVFFLTYLSLTVLLFAFGPWPYPVQNGAKLYFYLFCTHVALLIGYLTAANRKPGGYYGRWSVGHLVVISSVISALLFFPTSKLTTGSYFPDIRGALGNLGIAYFRSQALRQEGVPVVMYMRIFLAPFTIVLLPLTVFYWGQLRPFLRRLALVVALGDLVLSVSIGTNAGVARFLFIAVWLLFASSVSKGRRLQRRRPGGRVLVLGVIAFVLIFSFFTSTMLSRGSSVRRYYSSTLGVYADENHILMRSFPPELQVGVAGLSSYITQGYYALYLALDEPFVPMFGVGNSQFLFRQAARIVGMPEILDLPYPVRLQKYGWDAYGHWSTIYPWLASDLSFPGTILLMFLIGHLFAMAWLDTLNRLNPFAVVMFSQFLIMLLYFPANNQLLQGGEGLVAFWSTLILWLLTRTIIRRVSARMPQ
ncbi:MAG: hypothetical protein JW892_00095 [Anaerolineae bacterium]|nr:hypothetical protein [Anaerolineae bacterium]